MAELLESSENPLNNGEKKPKETPLAVDLENYFSQETAEKAEPEDEFAEMEAAAQKEADEAAKAQLKEEKAEKEEKEGVYNFGDSSETIIDIIDQLQTLTLPFVHQLALLNSDDRKALKHLSRRYREHMNSVGNDKNNKKEFTLSEYDQELLEMQEDMKEYEKDLPFTEKEREQLKKPLKDLLSNSDFKMSPGGALAWSATIVMLPRFIPIIAGAIGRFMKK